MDLAQRFFDDYLVPASPEELEGPILHSVLEMPELRGFVYGGKGIGSGGDGSVQFVCKSREDREKAKQILESKGFDCLELDLKPAKIKKDNLGMLLDELHKKVPVYGYVAPEGNIDIGTPDLLKKAEEEVKISDIGVASSAAASSSLSSFLQSALKSSSQRLKSVLMKNYDALAKKHG